MDKAKAAVSSFIGRAGHHDTTVTESVAPGITKEDIKPTRHENVQETVDREVQQDHYHTTVQPIQHQEVLPEQHSHNVTPVQKQEFHHDDTSQTRQKLESEAARFKDTSTTHETRHTTSVVPRAEGEHVHHHVHEHVQPVVHKETIQPEVVHTTVPVHEVHRAEAEHHGTSVLPVKKMEEFTAGGGILTGDSHKAHETYEGDPRPYNSAMQMDRTDADTDFKAHDGLHDHQRALRSSGASNTTPGPHSSSIENKLDPRVGSDRDGGTGLGTNGAGSFRGTGTGSDTTGTGIDAQNMVDPHSHQAARAGAGFGAVGVATGAYKAGKHHDTNMTETETGIGDTAQMTSGSHSSNLENKLDPRVDSNHDTNAQGNSRSGLVGSSNDTSTITDNTRVENSNTTDRSTKMSDNPDTDTREQAPSASENAAGNAKGQDPSVVDDKGRKLTGTAASGSHSALFGLTPDGHKEAEVDYSGSKPMPASGEDATADSSGDTGSRAPDGSGVQEQFNDPRVAEKGHGGGKETTDAGGGKPGAGGSLAGPSQGTGQVGEDA